MRAPVLSDIYVSAGIRAYHHQYLTRERKYGRAYQGLIWVVGWMWLKNNVTVKILFETFQINASLET
jgi:hypothetical protein